MSPLLSVFISLIAFEIGVLIYKKTKFVLFNPLLIGIMITMGILLIFDIPVKEYTEGANIITFFLAPATVVLAIPLYNQIDLLKKHIKPILIGIGIGSITAILSVVIISKLIGLDQEIVLSLLPKSITTAIGIEITKSIGADISLTVAAIVATGITGAAIGSTVCNLAGIKEKIAVGIAFGTASHAIGTSKAIEIGEIEGAMSGLSIAIAGIMTVFIIPIILKIFL